MPRSSSGTTQISRLAGHHSDDASIASATKRGPPTPSSKAGPGRPPAFGSSTPRDPGLAPANSAPPELGIEGDHGGRPRIHQPPEPGRDVVGCRSSSWVAADCGSRSMTQRTASTTTVGSLSCGKWLEPAAWNCRLSSESATRASWFSDRRSATSSGIWRLGGGRAAVTTASGTSGNGGACSIWRHVSIDPAGLVGPAIPAQWIADLEDGVQGTDPAGLELGHRPIVWVCRLDHHHARHVIRQPPGEQLHVQAAERVTEQQVGRGSLDHRQQVAQRANDERAGLRFSRAGASADARPVVRDDHSVTQERPEHPAPPVERSAGAVDEDDRGRARSRRDVLDRRASHLGQSSGRERGEARRAHEFASSLHSAMRRSRREARSAASLPSSTALSPGSARR